MPQTGKNEAAATHKKNTLRQVGVQMEDFNKEIEELTKEIEDLKAQNQQLLKLYAHLRANIKAVNKILEGVINTTPEPVIS